MPGSRVHEHTQSELVKLKNIYEIPAWARIVAEHNISTRKIEGMIEADVSFEVMELFLALRDVYIAIARN